MKMFVDVTDIYLHKAPVDFRKGINGLSLIVEQHMNLNPFSEALFVFCNRTRDNLESTLLTTQRLLPLAEAPRRRQVLLVTKDARNHLVTLTRAVAMVTRRTRHASPRQSLHMLPVNALSNG